ncbi:tetratricopeptide repeat protein [Mongoliibacter ruber]|uniref:TolA-binding protein n=1 Tax=Mongoliibacter ruber TaxID=1750599 RepID=A0A2T0WW46_9BACT|nr:tetratricopeptide repeat protein [Mongoliibacter ruber]PRY90910.1 TolA-binding protein [Mongoliibacter ruber]
MKKSLVLLLILGMGHAAYSQSSLYQTSELKQLDDHFELFQKHLFSASKYEFEDLKTSTDENEVKILSDFYYAISSIKIDIPGSSDLVYAFIRDYRNHPKTNEAAHVLGNFFFENRNYREAIPAFEQVKVDKVSDVQRSEVIFKTGYAYFQLGDLPRALSYFNQIKGKPGEYSADAFYYAGFIAMNQGNYEQASRDFGAADKSQFYSTRVPYMLAGVYYRQAQYDELISYAENVLQNRKNLDRKEEIHLYLAEAYFEKRNFNKAAENYDAFVNARKGDLNRSQIYKAGISQFEIENFQRASDYFKVSAGQNDEIGQVSSYYLGHAYVKLNNPQFASNSFSAAYKSEANSEIREDALINFAKVNLERGSFQDAVGALDTYLDSFPNGKHAREAEALLTDALINTNNYLRAIEHIEGMPNKSQRIREAYQKITFYQGIVYYRDNRHDLATNYFDKSIATPVNKDLVVQAYFWKGEALSAKGDLPTAIRAYEAVQNQRPNPNDPYLIKSYYGLGYSFFNTEQYTKAETQFRNYVDRKQGSTDPENYDEALIRLGDVYYVQKKFSEAQNIFQRAIRENNDFIDYAYFRSGVVFNFQNRNDEAIQQMNNLINNYPSSLHLEDAIYQKSQINMEEMRYADARDGFGRLISSKPNSPFIPFALEGRAVANFSLQNYSATIDDYKRILENHPNSSNSEAALVGLQEALAIEGRSAEFSQYLTRFRGANPDNTSLQNLEFEAAKALYFDNSWQPAIQAFESYLRNYPQASNRTEAVYFIAESHYKADRKDLALENFYRIEREKDSNQRLRAVQRIAAIEMENKNYGKALAFLRESSKNARNQIEEYEANRGLMVAHFETETFDSAAFYSDKVIALGNVTVEAVPAAMLIKAKSLLKRGNTNQAELVFKDLIDEFKTVHGAEALFLLAEIQNKAGEFEKSNETIFDLSGPYSGYGYWYGRTFVLLAENYIKLDEDFQAKATLESIIANSNNEEVIKLAKEKLNKIN